MSAARLILERVVPPLKSEELPVALGEAFVGTRTELVAAVVAAIADGQLDTSRGGRLIALLSPDALEEKAERLERMFPINPTNG